MIKDVVAGGTLMTKIIEAAYAIFEDMSQNHYQWKSDLKSSVLPHNRGLV